MVDSKMMASYRQLRWPVLFSILLLMGGCSESLDFKGLTRFNPNQSSIGPDGADAQPRPAVDPSQTVEPTQASLEHGQRLSTTERDLPPGRLPLDILPATTDTQRISQIQPGRQDPFSSLPVRPVVVQREASISPAALPSTPPTTTSPRTVPVPATPQAVAPVPISRQQPTVPLSTNLAPPSSVVVSPAAQLPATQLPAPQASAPRLIPVPSSIVPSSAPETMDNNQAIPAIPTAPTRSPAIAFSGVVQVGDRVNIIVEEPSGSRYVTVGATVGNGQFVIKAVDFARGATPAIILDRGGVESVHWVGEPVAFSPRP